MKNLPHLLTTLLLLSTCAILAQGIEKTPVYQFMSSSYRTMATGDLDNNGIVDLLTADEQILWFEGTGTTALGPQHTIQAELPEYVSRIFLRDINNDGSLDIYYYLGAPSYAIGILYNPGVAEALWEQYELPGWYSDVIGFFDVDNDGDNDFVFEDNISHLGYRENNDNTFETYVSIPDTYSDLFYYFTEDIDLDGDTDWVGYFNDCCTKYFRSNGNGTFTVSSISSDEYMSGVHNVDVNNDGYSDVVYYSSSQFEVSYYSAVTNTFGSQTYLGDVNGFTLYSFIDLDNDGDKDMVFSFIDTEPYASYYSYEWIQNMGPGFGLNINDLYLQPIIPESPYTVHCKTMSDITNDGLPDLIANFSDGDGDHLVIFNNELPYFNIADTLDLPFAPNATEVLCFDMDADPDNDLVIGFDNGTLGWYEYDHLTDTFSVLHTILALPLTPEIKNIKKKDIDNDGDFDLIASFVGAGVGGEVTYYCLNDGEGVFTNYLLDDEVFMNIWLMDADEDGDMDFTAMVSGYSANLVYYENTGIPEALFVYSDDVSSLAEWNSFVEIDIDQDGDPDMIGAREYTYQIKSFINEDGAGAFTTQANYFSAECNDVKSLFASDFDNDGDDDVVYVCESGYTYLSRNDGGSHEQIFIGTFDPTTLVDGSHTALFDLNMDGYEDLIYNKVDGGSGYKLAAGPGTFETDYDAFSTDFGRFSNVDAGFTPDFIGIDQAKLYVQYNILMLAPSFEISEPTTSWIEEGGLQDSLTLVFNSIPQTPLNINITPSGAIDAGAGEGTPYTITIPADETALDTITIYLSVNDDLIVEDVASGIVSITADAATWGMYTDLLNAYHTYTTVDNDLGIFFSPPSLTFTEGVSSDTVYAHINIATEAITTVSITDNENYIAGFGAAVADAFTLASGIDAIIPFTISAFTPDDVTYTGDIATSMQLTFTSEDLQINAFTPEPIDINITENDVAEIIGIFPAVTISEGIEYFDISLGITSAPVADVQIIATPDLQIDLGAGQGIPVTIIFNADGTIPEPVTLTGYAVDDFDVEYTHNGTINFTILSDDPDYTDVPLNDLMVTINDNDAPQGITVVAPAEDFYLEGTNDIVMSIALWTNPYETVLIHAQPEATLDLGAGAGTAITIAFEPTDDATEPRIILIDAVNNIFIEPDPITAAITFTIETTDPVLFDDAIAPITITIEDDDALQGIQLATPIPVPYAEGTSDLTMSVLLNTIPNAPVSIIASPNTQLDLGAGAGMPISIELAGASATEPHEINIQIVEDLLVEGVHYGEISFTIITDDPVVAAMTMDTYSLEIIDNDEMQYVTIVYDFAVHTEGDSDIPMSFSLATAPNDYVIMHLYPDESLDLGAGQGVSVAINFMPDSSATIPQYLSMAIGNNFMVDGFRTEYIIIEIETYDPVFDLITVPDIDVMIADDDETQGVTVLNGWTDALTEGTTGQPLTFEVWTQPNFPVTILATTNEQLDLGYGPGISASVAFMPDETWETAGIISVSVTDDAAIEGDHYALIEYTIITDDPQFDGYTIPMTMINITDNDLETSISDQANAGVGIYPNINNGYFTLHAPQHLGGTVFTVINANAQIVYTGTFEPTGTATVNISGVASGTYWLMCTQSGQQNGTPIYIIR